MEASACLYRTHSSCFRRNTWVDAPTPYDYDLRQRQRDEQNPCNGWSIGKMRWSIWTDCITSISHVLKLNGYGGRNAKVNEKSQCFKGWETLVNYKVRIRIDLSRRASEVRFLRAPWPVWWSIIYGFHTTILLEIRRKYSIYSCNTKATSCDSW